MWYITCDYHEARVLFEKIKTYEIYWTTNGCVFVVVFVERGEERNFDFPYGKCIKRDTTFRTHGNHAK